MRIIRTTFLLGVLTLFLMMVGQYFGGRNGMTLGLGIAVCTNAFAYFFSDKIALLSSGARPVSREELPRLYAVVERLASKANLPVPKLYVIPEAAPNAFATGRSPRHASVAVRSEEHTSELQSRLHLVCRLLLEKKKCLHHYTVRL